MKKLLAVLMLLALLATLAACGPDDEIVDPADSGSETVADSGADTNDTTGPDETQKPADGGNTDEEDAKDIWNEIMTDTSADDPQDPNWTPRY